MRVFRRFVMLVLLCVAIGVKSQNTMENAPSVLEPKDPVTNEQYVKDWSEIDKRKLPAWFNEAKFGIFVVWGPYSVPAYSPVGPNGYAEWYWSRLRNGDVNVLKFHKENYGDLTMEEMADDLTAEFFDADVWCKLFKCSGAKYVITTSNYHDGFAMYPTKYSVTESTDQWNSMVRGPKRDIIGELNEAGNKAGLKMGIYFSLYEWYHPLWLTDRDRYVTEHFHPKFKEVVERYKPWSIFFDGDWSMGGHQWRSNELAKWLYTESSVKDIVVTNDRWSGSSRGQYGDVFESEYGYGKWTSPEHPWQEDRGIGQSYGYNRAEDVDDYNSTDELLEQLSLVTAGGGNFLLCVGPTADGRIPVIMQQRLVDVGKWLEINGEAIYGATANPFWPRTFDWGTITTKQDKLYLHLFNPNDRDVVLDGIKGKIKSAHIINNKGEKIALKTKHLKGVFMAKIPLSVPLSETINVIELETEGELICDKRQRVSKEGELFLTGRAFQYTNPNIKARYSGYRDNMRMVGWNDVCDFASAEVIFLERGEYEVELTYIVDEKNAGANVEIKINDVTLDHTTEHFVVGKEHSYEAKSLGRVVIDKEGVCTIKIVPKQDTLWKPFGFQSIKLSRVDSPVY